MKILFLKIVTSLASRHVYSYIIALYFILFKNRLIVSLLNQKTKHTEILK